MSDQAKIDEAAEEFGKRSQKSGYERAESERGFKIGITWRDSNPSPAVKGLVEALDVYLKSRSVVEKELDWDAYESVNNALAAYKEMLK